MGVRYKFYFWEDLDYYYNEVVWEKDNWIYYLDSLEMDSLILEMDSLVYFVDILGMDSENFYYYMYCKS